MAGARSSGRAATTNLSTLDQLRTRADKSISQIKSLLKAIRAPLPTRTGDGSQLPEEPKIGVAENVANVWKDLNRLGIHGVEDLAQVFKKKLTHEDWDDKDLLMERLIQAAARLPPDNFQKTLTNQLLTKLWDELDHPPQSLLGDQYMYRQPDGGGNNHVNPDIGKAKMPYARSVAPKLMQDGAMPDPSILFDTCMARKGAEGMEHPNKISSMLFYLASIIIHDVFKTNHDDYNISDTSSYLDLAPLYGSNWEEQKKMRTMNDGRIHPDCFSETRLLSFPAGVGALLILFNRYHNYVAENLARINEGGRFSEDPKQITVERYGEKINKRDDDLFQTARLVTCGVYINIILIDYVRTILNLNRTDEDWQLNPRVDIPNGPAVGTGNQVSCEFNLVYRWHAAVSERDAKWTEQLFEEQIQPKLNGLTVADAAKSPQTMYQFLGVLKEMQEGLENLKPQDRPFPALKEEVLQRIKEGPNKGSYNDDDLAKIVVAGIEDCANAMGPQQVPPILKIVEILGIMQARTWRVATLNEFRKHFALKPYADFSDITDNVEVQEALRHLYDTPDNVELYPGLVLEDTKDPMIPGSGLCPSRTTGRAVLADAVALVRGDRYYTTSYTPAALTNWGYQEASSDTSIDNGCVFYKLISRALPNNFDQASVYAHYPLTVPIGEDGMIDVLQGLGKAHRYTFDRPQTVSPPTVVYSSAAANRVIKETDAFRPTWGRLINALVAEKGANFLHVGDIVRDSQDIKASFTPVLCTGVGYTVLDPQEKWVQRVKSFYAETTTRLLSEKSYHLGNVREVDLVRDVGNLVNVKFAAELFGLPVKTQSFPHGVFTEHQLYFAFMAIFTGIFFDLDPPKTFAIRQQSYEIVQELGSLVKLLASALKATENLPFSPDKIVALAIPPSDSLEGFGGLTMIKQMIQDNTDVDELVWGKILPACGAVLLIGEYFAATMDYFLGEKGKQYLPSLNRFAKQNDAQSDEKLLHYALEAVRLGGEVDVIREAARDQTLTDNTQILGKQTYKLKKGDRVVVNPGAAQRDPSIFSNPDDFNPDRPLDSYSFFIGDGLHQILGKPIAYVALPEMLRAVAKLDGLRPAMVAIGPRTVPGGLKKVPKNYGPPEASNLPKEWQFHAYTTESWDMLLPFPTTLKVQWEPTTKGKSNGLNH